MKSKDLEYCIGGLEIDLPRLHFTGMDLYDATHLFVVQYASPKALIYVCPAGMHLNVVSRFKLFDKEIVGGGSCFTNGVDGLFLGDYSGDYGAIPRDIAEIFAKQILKELSKKGLEIDKITLNDEDKNINPFWKA